jgi:uncharacterized membrane protein YqjE
MDPGRQATGNLGSYAYSGKPTESERSIAEILKESVTNVQELIRAEVQLAKVELRQEAAKAKSAGILLGAGAAMVWFGAGFLLLSLMFALANVLPMWAAALITGVLLLATGAFALTSGRAALRDLKMPEKTIRTAKEDVEWIRNQNKS